MRPNQQNKRSRGRNNGGRKHVNPMSRNFESNGPDVKIRGNASHIADKYVQLARDATASGDLIMAENYFQHAEHYFRIVSAAQQQNQQRAEQQQPSPGSGNESEDGDDTGDDRDTRSSRDDTRREQAEARPNGNADTKEADTAKEAEADKEVVAAKENGDGATVEDKPAAPKRRRRTKSNGADEEQKSKSEDSGDSAQPDPGELPAFLTN